MSNAPAQKNNAHPYDSGRVGVLSDIGSKWSKFSQQELSALKTNDELVTQVVDKYGVEKTAAQREVDTLMKGRNLKM